MHVFDREHEPVKEEHSCAVLHWLVTRRGFWLRWFEVLQQPEHTDVRIVGPQEHQSSPARGFFDARGIARIFEDRIIDDLHPQRPMIKLEAVVYVIYHQSGAAEVDWDLFFWRNCPFASALCSSLLPVLLAAFTP